MLFNSLSFAIFLPIVLIGYYLLKHRGQNRLLLVASLFFYSCWDWRFTFLLLLTIVVDFFVAAYLDRLREEGASEARRKRILAVSMACNLLVLGIFKYLNFFIDSMANLLTALHLPVPLETLQIVLPVGISFYTFQSMSYTIDVYRGELKATRNILDFAVFVSFFPHLVAGPIMRAVDLLPQVLKPRRATREQWRDGLHLIVWGLWKKVFVADNLALTVNAVFDSPDPMGFQVLIAVYAFAFQIYCDFSGYTDIARGVAKLMGFELTLNFNLPYFATSPQEFWSRWHISLSSWLRNYLYIPLGGSRGSSADTYRNLMLTMVIGGLWHGAAWNFVLWGFYQGSLLVVHRLWQQWRASRFPQAPPPAQTGWRFWLKVIVMFQFTCYGWLLFRATSFEQIAHFTAALAHPLQGLDVALLTKVSIFVLPLLLVQLYQHHSGNLQFMRNRWMAVELKAVCYSVLVYLAAFHAAAPQAFIYFQF